MTSFTQLELEDSSWKKKDDWKETRVVEISV